MVRWVFIAAWLVQLGCAGRVNSLPEASEDSGRNDGPPDAVASTDSDDDGAVEVGAETALPGHTPGTALRVFVTSELFGPDFGGLSEADGLCQRAANLAKLPGRYLAWLSVGTSTPANRFGHDGPYARVDGVVVAASWSELIDGVLDAPISVTEDGLNLSAAADEYAWTDTKVDGTSAGGEACGRWTGKGTPAPEVGSVSATNGEWTSGPAHICRAWRHRLYCFEQP